MNMCMINSSKLSPCCFSCFVVRNTKTSRGLSLHNRRLIRSRRLTKQGKEKKVGIVINKEMKIKNLKLYMENKSIMEENKRLRKKALLLHQENQALLFQLQKVL